MKCSDFSKIELTCTPKPVSFEQTAGSKYKNKYLKYKFKYLRLKKKIYK